MALFQKEEVVFEKMDFRLGELNYESPTGTGYDNVLPFGFAVKKNRKLRLSVKSDTPIDVVIARSDNSVAAEEFQVTDKIIGPVDTKDDVDMGILVGTWPGDRATVSLRAWTDSK